jgi:hypothetical protein
MLSWELCLLTTTFFTEQKMIFSTSAGTADDEGKLYAYIAKDITQNRDRTG